MWRGNNNNKKTAEKPKRIKNQIIVYKGITDKIKNILKRKYIHNICNTQKN